MTTRRLLRHQGGPAAHLMTRVSALLLVLIALRGSPAGTSTVSATPPGCVAPLTPSLQPGLPYLAHTVPAPSPDIPPGAVVIHVPLYPGALPTTQQAGGPIFATASPYLKAAAATYALPTDAGTATVWYQQQFARCGYRVSAHGQTSTAQGLSTSVEFTSRSNTNLTVQLGFQDTARGSLVLYVAEDVTVPPRPPGSYLPRDIVRVNVTYLLPLPQKPGVPPGRLHRAITNPAAIHTLVAAINALRQIVAGPHTCPLDNGQSATMTFVRRNGRTVQVYDEPVCVGVVVGRYPPLIDEGRRVWNTITALIQPGTGAGTMRGLTKQKQCAPSVPAPAVCDRVLGVALTVPKGWSVVPREKFPPGYLAFWTLIPRSQEPPLHLVIEPVGLASACTDSQAALAVAEALARTTTSRHPIVRRRSIVAGAPAVYLYDLPGTPMRTVQIIVAHHGAVYQLIFPGSTRALRPDQWHALASLRFIPRLGPFPRRPDPSFTPALQHCATVHRQPSPSFPRQITVGRNPAALAIDQRTRRLFVMNMGGPVPSTGTVTIVDAKTGTVLRTVTVVRVVPDPRLPGDLVVDERRGRVFVANGDGTIAELRTATGRLVRTFPVSMAKTMHSFAGTLAVDAATGRLIVADPSTDSITVLSPSI